MIVGSCVCGAVRWTFDGVPESATACNCTACRRYGALWAYDYEGERIQVTGPTQPFVRGDSLGFHFCRTCGCVSYWRTLAVNKEGKWRIGVSLRMAEPGLVNNVPVDHFDGLDTWNDLPSDGRCVRDLWF